MAGKRKFDSDDDTNTPTSAKQLKLVPFPSYVHSDMDMNMDMDVSDDAASPALYPRSTNVSNASNTSSAPSSPSLFVSSSLSRTESLPTKPVGLMGCSVLGDAFQHHGNCTQLPKLRMACAAGGGRSRTMWSHCEQCGAIAMVDLD